MMILISHLMIAIEWYHANKIKSVIVKNVMFIWH